MNSVVRILTVLVLVLVAGITAQSDPPTSGADTASSSDESCSTKVGGMCKGPTLPKTLKRCSITTGVFPNGAQSVQNLVKKHIQTSVDFLLMGNVFSEWKENRKGFQNFFHKLSDDSWDDAVALIQHIILRGGTINNLSIDKTSGDVTSARGELAALSRALDLEKVLVDESFKLLHTTGVKVKLEQDGVHGKIEPHHPHSDGELAHFMAGELSSKLLPRLKNLADHVHMLSDALKSEKVNKGFILDLYENEILA